MASITLDQVKDHPLVSGIIEAANNYLGTIGYTEHGFRHASLVSHIARNVLKHLDHPDPFPELAAIAGYLHDIGNAINRDSHGQTGALLSIRILRDLKMDSKEISYVASSIGNHEEKSGHPVNAVAAALILADKSDVHRTRVRTPQTVPVDIHDRVNYAVERSFLNIDKAKKVASLQLVIDTAISQVMEYFEIFLDRMTMCRRAAHLLGLEFELIINERKLL